MENQNNINLNSSSQIPPAPVQPKLQQALEKIKSQISLRFSAFTPSQKRLLKIGGGVFAFAIVFLILAGIVKSMRPAPTPPPAGGPTPAVSTPLPTPAGIGNPSRYATDSAVLKIDDDVKNLQAKLEGTNLDESNLRPPDINFFVSFTP